MDKKVLVTYGSKRGSTAEIAEKIGQRIRQNGLYVDILDVIMVNDLTSYNRIVLGSSVYFGLWHRKVVRFMKKNMGIMENIPTWFFICGPTGTRNPVEQMAGWFYPKSLKPIIDKIHPRDITCFGGRLELKKLNVFEKWIINNVKALEGDFRDWRAIEAWADKIK